MSGPDSAASVPGLLPESPRADGSEGDRPVPWDLRAQLGFWRAWWRTLKESLTGPDRFFARACNSPHTKAPLLYATVAVWLGTAWLTLVSTLISLVVAGERMEPAGIRTVGLAVGSPALVPLAVLALIYVAGAVPYLGARLSGGQGGYRANARALAFAMGPCAFGVLHPVVLVAGAVASAVLVIFAMKHVHRLSGGRAAMVVLLPLLPLGVVGFFLAFVAG